LVIETDTINDLNGSLISWSKIMNKEEITQIKGIKETQKGYRLY